MRHRDQNWNLPAGVANKNGGFNIDWDTIKVSVLMDIRDELKSLNQVLHCPNALDIPHILRDIRRNTTRKRRKRGQP